MPTQRYSLLIALILCLVLQGSGLSFASANGVADCGMDMQQMKMMPMSMQQGGHDHSTMLHGQTPFVSVDGGTGQSTSAAADCCDADDITRSDCNDMPDCQSCGSMITLSIPNRTATSATSPSSTGHWLHPPSTRAFSPPDLWRPPMSA
ncbi:MAG: hypothetical protein Q7U82_08940 [Gammaproteobacteria bacterium]|nr:hypothetical protein [Gammaproteobacteria bacterium]